MKEKNQRRLEIAAWYVPLSTLGKESCATTHIPFESQPSPGRLPPMRTFAYLFEVHLHVIFPTSCRPLNPTAQCFIGLTREINRTSWSWG